MRGGRTVAAVGLILAITAGAVMAAGTATPGSEPSSVRDNITLGLAILGSVTGVLGLGVSVYNTLRTTRLRVKVRPEQVRIASEQQLSILIDVINFSAFHVTVAEIGFTIGREGRRFPIRTGTTNTGGELPIRLDPRESVAVHVYPYRSLAVGSDIKLAYARLASGEIITGTSPALRALSAEVGRP